MLTDITMTLLALVVACSLLGSLVLIFGGLLFGGMPRVHREDRDQPAASPRAEDVPAFFVWDPADLPKLPASDEVLLRRIEHHLRLEALLAEQFIQNPSSETLRATERAPRVH